MASKKNTTTKKSATKKATSKAEKLAAETKKAIEEAEKNEPKGTELHKRDMMYLSRVRHGMRIYISGPIGKDGVTDTVRERFETAEKMLSKAGAIVINPAGKLFQESLKRMLEMRQRMNTPLSLIHI